MKSTEGYFKQWKVTQIERASSSANSMRVISGVREILKAQKAQEEPLQRLAMQKLREQFKEMLALKQFRSFFVIDNNYLNIAAADDADIGQPSPLLQIEDFLPQIFRGETLISRPIELQPSAKEGADTAGKTREMFIVSPIFDANRAVIAALALQVALETEFSQIAEVARLNESGETYMFNHEGLMISESRFQEQLVEMGLLQAGQSSAFEIAITDPGEDLTKGFRSSKPQGAERPLTLMARSAIQYGDGSSVQAYADYRGVPVVGAWKWYPDLRLGITTEIDYEEAFRFYYEIRNILYGVVAVIIFLLLTLVFVLATARNRALHLVDERTKDLLHRSQELEREIFAHAETGKKLAKAKDEAEASARTKANFLANMSHEIRTPMNSILGFIELSLEYAEVPEKIKEYLSIANNSAKGLLTIINDVLDISKLDSGKFVLEKIKFYLPRLLKDTVQALEINARKKSLELNVDIQKDILHCFISDPNRLRQILSNLIGNAIKFTESGSISVSVLQNPEGELQFSVKDTGIGMTAEQVRDIFQPFKQADDSIVRRFGGTGLGTTISKQLIELLGGKIWVESEMGKGSTFYFTIEAELPPCMPHCNLDCEGRGISETAALYQSERAFQILLAEDIPENVALAQTRLEQQGHSLEVAGDGNEAIAAFEKGCFDIILMDVQMPVLDGLEATRRIRRLEAERGGGHIPILALTASVLPEDRQMCLDAGMDLILEKPIRFDHLFQAMEDAVPEG
ncbi:MAG: ATP-binding protein, partial [Spirochaetota bacterium]